MSVCDICKKGVLIQEATERSIEITCTHCGRGWHIPLTPSHVSPCMDPRFSFPEPRTRIRDTDEDYEDRDIKPEEEEGE